MGTLSRWLARTKGAKEASPADPASTDNLEFPADEVDAKVKPSASYVPPHAPEISSETDIMDDMEIARMGQRERSAKRAYLCGGITGGGTSSGSGSSVKSVDNVRWFSEWRKMKRREVRRSRRGDGGKLPLEGTSGQLLTNPDEGKDEEGILKEVWTWYINRHWKKKAITLLAVLTIVPIFLDLIVFRSGHVRGAVASFMGWMRENEVLGVWAYIVVLIFACLISIPPSLLVFASGFVFHDIYGFQGMIVALIASYIGVLFGGVLGFLRAQYMTRDLVEILGRRYPIIRAADKAIAQNSLRVMMLLRTCIFLPFGVMNYFFGISGAPWESFALSMIAVLPLHTMLIYLGAGASSIFDDGDDSGARTGGERFLRLTLLIIGAVLGAAALAIVWRYAKEELQKEVDQARSDHVVASGARAAWTGLRRKSQKDETAAAGGGDEKDPTTTTALEDADPTFTDYVLMQVLGEGETSTVNDQADLSWSEMLLDDFS